MFEIILIRIVGNHRRVTQHPGAGDIPGVDPQGHVLRSRSSKRRRRCPQRHFVTKRQSFARGKRVKHNLRAALSSVANQCLRVINAETSHDLPIKASRPQFECGAKPSRYRNRQSDRVVVPRPNSACKRRPQCADGVGNLAWQARSHSRPLRPISPKGAPAGQARTAAEAAVQSVYQDRQIGLPRIARTDKYSQRSQGNAGLGDWAEIQRLYLQAVLLGHSTHDPGLLSGVVAWFRAARRGGAGGRRGFTPGCGIYSTRHGRSKGGSPAQRFSFWPARAVRGLTRLCPRKSGDGLAAATDLHRSFPGTSAPSRKRGLRRRRPSRAPRAGRRDAGAAGKSAAGARNCLETARGRATLRTRRSSLRSTMNLRPETRCCGRKAGVRGALPEAAGEITP